MIGWPKPGSVRWRVTRGSLGKLTPSRGVAIVLIINGIDAAEWAVDLVQAKYAPDQVITVVETPGGFLLARQDNLGHPAFAVQLHFITRQRLAVGATAGFIRMSTEESLRLIRTNSPWASLIDCKRCPPRNTA